VQLSIKIIKVMPLVMLPKVYYSSSSHARSNKTILIVWWPRFRSFERLLFDD